MHTYHTHFLLRHCKQKDEGQVAIIEIIACIP